MKKLFTFFAGMLIVSAMWAQETTADADPGEIKFDDKTVATPYHFSSEDKVKKYFDEKEVSRLTQTEADRAAEHLFEPLKIISGFNRDVIAEDTVKLDMVKEDGTLDTDNKGIVKQRVTIAGRKRNGDHLVQSYYVQDADIENIKSAENPDGTNTSFKTQYISYSYATENVLKLVQNAPTGNYNTRAGFPDPDAKGIRRIECIADGPNDAYVGLHWHLAPYEELNALCLRKGIAGSNGGPERTGSFLFKNVGCYQKLHFLVAATGSGGSNRVLYTTVTYSDGTTDHRSFTFDDHANILKKVTGKVNGENKTVYDTTAYRKIAACHDNFGTYGTGSGVILLTNDNKEQGTYKIWHSQYLSYAIVCEMDVETHKLIDRIDFTTQDPEGKKNTSDQISLVIFAVTGQVADIATPVESGMVTKDITDNSFAISWDAVDGATSYRVDVATDEDFHYMVEGYNNETVIHGTDTTISNIGAGTDYYWRVRAVNDEGGQGKSSTPQHVRTEGTREDANNIEEEMAVLMTEALPVDLTILRTLYKDGYFNTLCLPFNLASLDGTPLAGGELFEFVSATAEGENLLEINISPVPGNIVEAGKPYLIRWANTGEVMTTLVFNGVKVTTSTGQSVGEGVQFVGHIGMERIEYENRYNLFLGENNQLYWPISDGTIMKGFRAYFAIPTGGPNPAPVKHGTPARLSIHPNVPTSVATIEEQRYTPVKIIENGQLVIIKNGVRYNVTGQQLH
ncbi:MAG: fibronectin type III domain-containing protein [Paludibacteraceae bacterium]|nr:fibronectin type III domain-containing protein [Paludibacteraceae bacterium]